jgi:hypothetical protein
MVDGFKLQLSDAITKLDVLNWIFKSNKKLMKNFWYNLKAFFSTFLFLIICQGFYALALRPVFGQSLFIVFALAILFVFVLRSYFFKFGTLWLHESYKKASSIILLKWIVPIFTFLFYSLPWFIMLIKDVWSTTHANWAKVLIIFLFTLLLITWSYSVLKIAQISQKAKLAFRSGHEKFTIDGEELDVSKYTLN